MARITEKVRIRIDRCEPTSPFYVTWVNAEGGWDHWLFDTAQDHGGNISRSQEYQPYFSDLGTTTTNSRVLLTSKRNNVRCFAEQLTKQEILGLETLLHSPRVYWLYDKANNLWKEVIPDATNYDLYATDASLFSFSVTFQLPKTNIPSN